MTLTEMFNVCDECAYCPSLCGSDPEICVREYAKLHQQPADLQICTENLQATISCRGITTENSGGVTARSRRMGWYDL